VPVAPVDQFDSAHFAQLRRAIKEAKTPEEEQAAYKAATDYKLSFVSADSTAPDLDPEPEPPADGTSTEHPGPAV